jgi:hypothetical protein
MDDEFYFTVNGYEWQQQSCYESEDHPVTEDQALTEGFVVTGCQRKWHKRSSVFKAGLAVYKEVYIYI